MQQHILLTCTKEELQAIITDCLQQVLFSHATQTTLLPQVKTEPAALLKTEDMCRLFNVSKVTIHNWRKDGKLPYLKKGRRVYFIEEEIMKSLAPGNTRRMKAAINRA